ncbi:MAG TPA: ribonuclease P protein component [Thermoanaerobaculia bacterium]|nr:ribonuclease P protein component [Thermoanaerobaculia bacterium]
MNSGSAARETFSRVDRLRKRREFEECYASGVRHSGRLLQVFLRPRSGDSRIGISVPRRVGNAVTRNRLRRRVREIFRRNRGLFETTSADLVIHVRPAAADVSFAELSEEYRRTVARGLARLR